MAVQTFYGKYRAKVVDSKDPEQRGRIRVQCPKVLGDAKSSWCEPCIPVAYDNGGDFAIPRVGEFVWVEFEEGNANKPIYTGGLWSSGKSPSSSYAVGTRIISWGSCKIVMSGSSINILAPSVRVNGSTVACFGDPVTVQHEGAYIEGVYIEGYIGSKPKEEEEEENNT